MPEYFEWCLHLCKCQNSFSLFLGTSTCSECIQAPQLSVMQYVHGKGCKRQYCCAQHYIPSVLSRLPATAGDLDLRYRVDSVLCSHAEPPCLEQQFRRLV